MDFTDFQKRDLQDVYYEKCHELKEMSMMYQSALSEIIYHKDKFESVISEYKSELKKHIEYIEDSCVLDEDKHVQLGNINALKNFINEIK